MNQIVKKYIMIFIVVLSFIVLTGRLVQLQLLGSEEFGKESEKNSIKKITMIPARGLMYDKKGKVLVDNIPSYSLMINPSLFDTAHLQEVSKMVDLSADELKKALSDIKGTNRFNPFRFKREVDFRTVSYIEENKDKFKGVEIQVEPLRHYPSKFKGSHIFGYVSEISQKQLENQIGNYYRQGDLVGMTGLENSYENYLRGEKGQRLVSVDVKGKEAGSYNNGNNDIRAVNGLDLILSVDSDLQEYAERLLSRRKGAIVALDPRTGEILCLVSKPDFNLEDFSGSINSQKFTQLINDKDKPLFNRVIQSKYPPGSTWKLMMGLTALDCGVLTPKSTISCEGSFTFGGRTWEDHGAYGSISIATALEKSANVFFYKLGLKVGLNNLSNYSSQFYFGVRTGIDIPNETKGFIPTEEYYNKVFPKGWSEGVLVNLGIGQGEILVSPIQLANYVAIIAMDGNYHQPHLVSKFRNPITGELEDVSVNKKKFDIPQSYFDVIKRGMYLVVNGTGTAANIKSSEYILAGKTGTAQNPGGNNHSWFVGFAPYNDPQIVVCVLGENAGWGNQFAAPMAAAVMIRYLSGNSVDSYNENSSVTIRD
jgi:penicillin-binding protein 2